MKSHIKKLQKAGRHGDTLVAHISPEEAMKLKAMGGAGTKNPKTGLLEFYDSGADGPDFGGFDGGYGGGELGGPEGGYGGFDAGALVGGVDPNAAMVANDAAQFGMAPSVTPEDNDLAQFGIPPTEKSTLPQSLDQMFYAGAPPTKGWAEIFGRLADFLPVIGPINRAIGNTGSTLGRPTGANVDYWGGPRASGMGDTVAAAGGLLGGTGGTGSLGGLLGGGTTPAVRPLIARPVLTSKWGAPRGG